MELKQLEDFESLERTQDIKRSKQLHTGLKVIKWGLVAALGYAYFRDQIWLVDIIVFSIAFALVFPLGFFDVFIQRLLEYNTQAIEQRQHQHAEEANHYFNDMHKRIEALELVIKAKNG